MQISRIRLSDKTSRLHPRQVMPKRGQAYEPEVPVKVWEWIGPALASPDLVLEAQPPAQPHSGVVVDRQLIVLRWKMRCRVQLTNGDRLFLVQLYRWFPSVLRAITIIRPETLVRWHRAGFRRLCVS